MSRDGPEEFILTAGFFCSGFARLVSAIGRCPIAARMATEPAGQGLTRSGTNYRRLVRRPANITSPGPDGSVNGYASMLHLGRPNFAWMCLANILGPGRQIGLRTWPKPRMRLRLSDLVG